MEGPATTEPEGQPPLFDDEEPVSRPAPRPGDRVIRRRVRATKIIDLPEPRGPARPPTPVFHARLFIAVFALLVLIGTGLLMLPWVTDSGRATPPQDALFIAMSALTVTGLVTVDTGTHWNWFGQFIVLVLIQIGGLGFMVGASLVLSILTRGGGRLRHQLMVRENIPTLTLSDAVAMARRIARFTFIIEGIGAVLLSLRFMQDHEPLTAIWYGIFHAVSALCNAGFDIQGNFDSLTLYSNAVFLNVVFIVLIQSGSLSYLVLHDVGQERKWNRLSTNARLVLAFNAVLLVVGGVIFLGAEWNGAMRDTDVWTRPLQAVFQTVTARTAGFSTADFSTVSTFTAFSYVALMFVGGASGSAAGGVKLATVGVILIAVVSEIRGRHEPEAFHRRIPISLIMRAMTIVTLFFLVHFVMTLALSGTEHLYGQGPTFVEVFFETMSAQTTTGLSLGITPELSTPGKLVLIVTMFLGRLGPLTIAYALAQRERVPRYRFPETTVHIG